MQGLEESEVSEESKIRHVRFAFYGEGSEFFRIWIVNLALTLVTLGIYSAWAKVRTKRYFYGNTELDGDRFDYLAKPLAILKGRVIAISALVIYTVVQSFFPLAALVLLAAVLIASPWIIVRSLRFNAVMSSWRGIRFGFDGATPQAALAYLAWPLFGIVTLGFGMPYAWYKQYRFVYSNYRFGESPTTASAQPVHFYEIFFTLIGAIFGVTILLVLGGLAISLVSTLVTDETGSSVFATLGIVAGFAAYFLLYLGMYVIYQALYFQRVYNHLSVETNNLRTDVTVWGWFLVLLVNIIGMLLTLGLFYPWARVRLSRYLLSHLWVEADDLDAFVSAQQSHENALGEEFGEAFDLGIGV